MTAILIKPFCQNLTVVLIKWQKSKVNCNGKQKPLQILLSSSFLFELVSGKLLFLCSVIFYILTAKAKLHIEPDVDSDLKKQFNKVKFD